jgi:bifunctional non-homologous end joining protein LigD
VPIDEYRRKRDFAKTPEPKPEESKAEGNRFVVHRHEARSLHYDLRIEAGGALACWAVPKGFSYLPEDKRLAVRTEDHPLMYESFEGSIPKGQYGAGTMRIWDAGTYQVRKAAGILQALEKGELKLELRGRRLRGEWHLVRTRQEQGKNWLLFKARDRYAGSGSDLFAGADMSRALEKPLPRRLQRMEAEAGEKPFDDPDWLFEPAFPGRRVLARVEDTRVSLLDGAEDLAARLPTIAKALASVRAWPWPWMRKEGPPRKPWSASWTRAGRERRAPVRDPRQGQPARPRRWAARSCTCLIYYMPRTGTCGPCPCGSARLPCADCCRIPPGCSSSTR